MAWRIDSVGLVTVSLRKSIVSMFVTFPANDPGAERPSAYDWPSSPPIDNTCAVDIPANSDPFSPEATDPLPCFHAWFAEARLAEPNDPDAMALATSTPAGLPSVRMVLLKEITADGSFLFYT